VHTHAPQLYLAQCHSSTSRRATTKTGKPVIVARDSASDQLARCNKSLHSFNPEPEEVAAENPSTTAPPSTATSGGDGARCNKSLHLFYLSVIVFLPPASRTVAVLAVPHWHSQWHPAARSPECE
jgi:hypothetical protein